MPAGLAHWETAAVPRDYHQKMGHSTAQCVSYKIQKEEQVKGGTPAAALPPPPPRRKEPTVYQAEIMMAETEEVEHPYQRNTPPNPSNDASV